MSNLVGKHESYKEQKETFYNGTKVTLILLNNIKLNQIDVKKISIEFKTFNHENVLHVFGLTNENGNFYIVREYANNGDLHDYIKNHPLIPWNEKIALIGQIVKGLKFLHDNNVIHSELHPRNILMHDSTPKLANIGISKINTPNNLPFTQYTAPEILAEKDINDKTKLNIYSLGMLFWEISSNGVEPFQKDYDISLSIKIINGARESPIIGTPLKYIDLYEACWDKDPDKRPNCSKVIEELNKISCEQVYNENAKNYECGNKYKNQIVISLDFDSSKSTNQIVNHFKLTKGRNRNGHDFDITKNDMLKNGEIKTCKKECVPTVYFEKKNTNPWEMLNDISSSQYSNGDNLFPDADTIQIHIPIRIIEYRGNLNDYFIKEVKDALNILDIYEKKIKLKGILDDYGNYVITKFTIGGTIYCSKASSKSIEHLQTYLNWGINYAKNESLPVFELTSLEDFPSFETLPSRPMKCVNDLYSWLKDLYDCKNVAIISYEGYKPFYELLDDKLKNEIFECFSFKPININLSKLIPQLSTAYEQKNFSEWASKPSILSHVHDLTKNLSLQYFISPKHYSNLGYGKRITFKFLKQPKIILNHKIFISFIHPQNQHITHLSYNVDESSYNITPIEDFKCSTQIYCQITYQVAEIFLDPSSILPEELFSKEFNSYKSFGNYYNHTLPKTFTIGGTLTTHEACGTPNIPYKFPQEILPGNINQILADLKINNTSFISNNGKIINKYQIKDWLEGFLTNPINWKINSFDDLFASYKTLYQLREDIEFISDNEYQFVFNGENLLSRDNQNIVVIKFTRPLINDNYLIFGNILKKCSNNLDESWERIPDATIAFSNVNRYGCTVIIYKKNNIILNKDITKIEWIVLAKPEEFYVDNYRDLKVTCGKLNIDSSQNEIIIKTNDIYMNDAFMFALAFKSQSNITYYYNYNITLKNWTKNEIVLKIQKEKQYQYIFEEEFEDFSNEDNKKLQIIKGGINPYSQEKIILNWCIINEKELKNKKLSLVRFILDDESRKDFDYLVDCDRNDLPSLDTTKKNALPTKHINFGTFNLGSFSCSDKNSKENEWKIQLAIKTENNESLANRDHSKNIKARNAHALKIPLVVPTLNSLVDEIKINIFKFILYPKNLSLTCKRWNNIVNDSQARAEWILYHYGNAHSLFHAIRLGPSFINTFVAQSILAKGGLLSRYFAQRLCMHFGRYDNKLIELKIRHMSQVDAERIRRFQQKHNLPWASNLPITVFTYLVTEASKRFSEKDLALKGNDLELFHFYTAGPHVIKNAQSILIKNMELIKTLIYQYKFIPFPPRLNSKSSNTPEEYPPKDGFENNRQLNVIARAIIIHKELVKMWIDIGYFDICKDVNDLVLQGAILILYPPMPSNEWTRPDVNKINERLSEFIELGFRLTYSLICDIFQLFEHRLDDIGEPLLESFSSLKKDEHFFENCIIETIKPQRNLKKIDLLEFLYRNMKQNKEGIFLNAMKFHGLDNHLIDNEKLKTSTPIKSLSLSPIYYYWSLSKFKSNSLIASLCFKDILQTRISIDIKRQNSDDILNGIQTEIEIACNIYNIYCNTKNFFLPIYLNSIALVSDDDILGPLFKGYLAEIYKLRVTFQFPLPLIEIENDVFPSLPPINDHSNEDDQNDDENNENNENIENNDENEGKEKNVKLIKEWSPVLEKMNHNINTESNEIQITEEFKAYFIEFAEKAF